jgi:hypothetical protein
MLAHHCPAEVETNEMPIDAYRRFVPTLIATSHELPDKTISVATNYQLLADRLEVALPSPGRRLGSTPAFAWRIVVESGDEVEDETLNDRRLSHDGLTIFTLGRKSFLACDNQARRGVAFVAERFVDNEKLFFSSFLPALLSFLNELGEAPL